MSSETLMSKYKIRESLAMVIDDMMGEEEEVLLNLTHVMKDNLSDRAKELGLRFLALTVDTDKRILYTYCLNGRMVESYPYYCQTEKYLDEYWRVLVSIDFHKKYINKDGKHRLPN